MSRTIEYCFEDAGDNEITIEVEFSIILFKAIQIDSIKKDGVSYQLTLKQTKELMAYIEETSCHGNDYNDEESE